MSAGFFAGSWRNSPYIGLSILVKRNIYSTHQPFGIFGFSYMNVYTVLIFFKSETICMVLNLPTVCCQHSYLT